MPTTDVASKTTAPSEASLRDFLSDYYGRVLKSNRDFEKSACCTGETSKRHGDILGLLPEEVLARHYGCGCPIPDDDLTGLSVLDLGSGSGVDCFVLAKLVGPRGFVRGIDMTDEQLAVARRAIPAVMRSFGHKQPNVAFDKGFIETCEEVPDGSIDLVVSDCVINLSPRKDQVLETISRVLRNGGELFLADIAADRRVPDSLRNDPRLIAECLGGAMYEHDWFDAMKDAGFLDPRVVRRSVVATEVEGEPITFSSLTVRAFKLDPPLDRRCEDYGQTAAYLGTIPGQPARWALDDHHVLEKGRPLAVCRNTARMLSDTRLAEHFQVTAPLRHFGLFPCGPAPAASQAAASSRAPGCC
jgi:ubiquinone/menaquinone biosynthesis C-methylase UbiE